MRKLYIDFDGVIVNSIACICSLYNEDFKYYPDFTPVKWWEINSWWFKECNCATKEQIDEYFKQPRFFEKITYMDWAKEVLDELKDDFEIIIVSLGYKPNLIGKEKWINENLPYCKFIGVDFDEYEDKSHIEMSDGIFIDDSISNLTKSNAVVNICFGEEYPWNKEWTGFRCKNWNDVKRFLKGDSE